MQSADRPFPFHRYRLAAAAALFGILLLLLPSACLRKPATSLPPAAPLAHPDLSFNRLFTRYGGGWTGGDGTLSIGLPDGRSLWLFGDTFLGHVRPDGSRPLDSPLIRNCLVVQNGNNLTTRYGGTSRHPTAFLVPQDPEAWFWPGDGIVSGDRLQVFYHRFHQVAPGMWGWAWDGTVIATLQLPALELVGVVLRDDGNGVAYGSALLECNAWVYIYGTVTQGSVKHLHVARALRPHLEDAWQFWTGRQWSSDAKASRSVLAGVSSQFGVVPLASGFGLVTMDERTPFSNRLVLYRAETPTGPWQGPIAIYQSPEADGAIAAYSPFVHPQFGHADGYLISYNLNDVHDPDRLYADAAIYRPRFIRADLEGLAAAWTPQGDGHDR